MRGLAFFRRLPRWARRLWYAILLVTAIELGLFIGTLVWAPGWVWLASEVFSFSAWPLGAGLAVVVVVGSYMSRRRRPSAAAPEAPASPREPSQREPAARPASKPAEGIEIAAARSAARLWAQASQRPEGQSAIRRTGRLARAMRAAARPPEGEDRPRS
ncbi:MAG: hypothetical protein M3Z97_14630 [Candidatus Dormibacteraeota bacterium]|nr:hypothetical protein [Candidatus Dormibacteraeota bacterium]